MTDEEFVFYKDVSDKKRIARGANNRKGSKGTKKCTMPSDYLTKKEKLAMNGEVKTLELNKFYTYEEFKHMTKNMQIEWLAHMCEKYKIGANIIAADIFGINYSTMMNYFHVHDIARSDYNPNKYTSKGRLYLIEDLKKARSDGIAEEVAKVYGLPEKIFETELRDTEEPETLDELASDENVATAQGPIAKIIDTGLEARAKRLSREIEAEAEEKPENSDYPDILAPVDRKPKPPATMEYAEFAMDGFDTELFDLLKRRFKGKNVRVSLVCEVIGGDE